MPSRSRRPFDDELILARVLSRVADPAAKLVQELVHPREAFFGRIDRAIDEWFLVVVARRERSQCDDQVLQFEHGSARFDRQHPARRRLGPRFGRPGDDDVARLRIAEHVLQPREPGQVLHRVVDAAAVGQPLLHDPLQARERHLAQRAAMGDVAIEPRERFLNALPRRVRRSDRSP